MPEWVIAVISVLVGTIAGFGLNLWRDKLLEKEKRRQDALEKHFEELKQTVITEILKIILGVVNDCGTLEASTTRESRTIEDAPFPISFGFEERNNYQALQAHYPEIYKTWRELITQILKHNEDVDATLEEIEEYINNNPDLPQVKLYDPPTEEKVTPSTIRRIYQAIYSIAQGQRPQYDFSRLHVQDYGDYQYIIAEDNVVAIIRNIEPEKCKSAFNELVTSKQIRDRALGIAGNASQIIMSLKTLAYNLDDIYSYGLISNKEGYKFQPNKDCRICNSIFY